MPGWRARAVRRGPTGNRANDDGHNHNDGTMPRLASSAAAAIVSKNNNQNKNQKHTSTTTAATSAAVVLLAIAVCILSGSSSIFPTAMGWRKFETVGMIPSSYFSDEQMIYAFTERVIDGDTLRVRHIPAYTIRQWLTPHASALTQPLDQRGIAAETLSIRIYGVDCPELAKTKSQTTQPFGLEAKRFTETLCLHRVVRITLLRKDQYGRAVCAVETTAVPPGQNSCWMIPLCFRRRRRDLSLELAVAGLAELYTGGGAEYWHRRSDLEQAVTDATARRVGIWSMPNRVSAADHKRLQKQQQHNPTTTKAKTTKAATATMKDISNRKPGGVHAGTAVLKKKATKTTTKQKSSSSRHTSKLLESAVTGLEAMG